MIPSHRRSRPELIRDLRSIVAQNETDIQRLWKMAKRAETILAGGRIYLPPEPQSAASSSSHQSCSSGLHPCSASGGSCCIPTDLTISVTTWNWSRMAGAIIHDYPNHFPQTMTYTTDITDYFTTGEGRWRGPCFEPVETSGGITQKSRNRFQLRCHTVGSTPKSPYPFLHDLKYDIWNGSIWTQSNPSCDGTIYEIDLESHRQNNVAEYEYTCDPFYLRIKIHFTNGGGADIQYEVTE